LLLEEAAKIPPSMRSSVFLGSWSPRHILAHLIGWDRTYVEAIQEIAAGSVPSFFGKYDRDWASFNATLVRRFNRGTYGNLIKAAANSSQLLLRHVEGTPAADVFADSGLRSRGRIVTIGRLLELEIRDDAVHAAQLRRFRLTRGRRRAQG
jgi:hypothetical protein